MPEKTYLIAISAPSGAGKTTLCHKLLQDFPSLILSVSSTTRPPRGSEEHGIEYFFLSQEDFKKQIQQERFAEWALVHGNYYGTSKDVIEEAFSTHCSVLLDIDVQGANQLKRTYPQECKRIFIAPPSLEALEIRLRSRNTDSEEAILKRLKNARDEIREGNQFESVIINDSLDQAYSELCNLLIRLGLSKGENRNG